MSTNKTFSTETSERYSRALFEVATEANEIDKVETDIKNFQILLNSSFEVKNFLLLLIEKRRIFFIKKISESFLRLCSKKRGEIKASLVSSKELSQIELEKISQDLSKSMDSSIKFDYKVDEKLIGGLKLQLGSFMIDTSIKNKLKKYEQTMLED